MAKSYVYSGDAGFLGGISARLREAGYTRVSEPAAADLALTFCTTQDQLEDLYYGNDGFVSAMKPGSLLVDFSASTPNFARELNAVATVSDLVMVEAPIVLENMVFEESFERDNLSCFAAGEEDGVARAKEVLDVVFGHVHETGGPGSAQLARAAFTMQVAAQVIAAIESEAMYRAFRRSVNGTGLGDACAGAVSPAAQQMLDAVRAGRFEGDYTVEMLMAELSAALMAADDAELILPQAESAMQMLELLAVIGGADKSPAALSLVYGEEAECAAQGLDWTRAEKAYGGCGHDHDCDCDDDCDCGCGHGHHDDGYGDDDYDDFGFDDFDFSSN